MTMMTKQAAEKQGFEILPGVQQLWNGTMFQHARKGNQTTMVEYVETSSNLSAESQEALEVVEVESLGYFAWLDLKPETEKQEAMKAAVLKRGPKYLSCNLYQGRRV